MLQIEENRNLSRMQGMLVIRINNQCTFLYLSKFLTSPGKIMYFLPKIRKIIYNSQLTMHVH